MKVQSNGWSAMQNNGWSNTAVPVPGMTVTFISGFSVSFGHGKFSPGHCVLSLIFLQRYS